MRNYFLKALSSLFIVFGLAGMIACGGGDDDSSTPSNVSVTPNSVSLLSNEGSSASIYIKTDDVWRISGCPEWLHMTATSGEGSTSVTLTTKSENFSAVVREAIITVSSSISSTTFKVCQDKYFTEGLEVSLSNMTIMSDGFACDLAFGSKAIGYREAFFTESDIRTKTERDIYNDLMKGTEYNKITNYAFSPATNPNTTLYYCIAAYGNESNPDGSHRYGPMTMQKITTAAQTRYADMVPSISYNSTRWTATASKSGTYGTRCVKYYYLGTSDDDVAQELASMFIYFPALVAHKIYKPVIAQYPDDYAVGAQSFYYALSNRLFFGLWGIDDNNNYSAETTAQYSDRSSSDNMLLKSSVVTDNSKWEELRRTLTDDKIEKMCKSVKVIVAK